MESVRKFFPTGKEIKGNSDSNAQKELSKGCQKPAGFQKLKGTIKWLCCICSCPRFLQGFILIQCVLFLVISKCHKNYGNKTLFPPWFWFSCLKHSLWVNSSPVRYDGQCFPWEVCLWLVHCLTHGQELKNISALCPVLLELCNISYSKLKVSR